MTPRSYWLEIEAADERESRLPKWAQQRIARLRAEANRLLRGTAEKTTMGADERVALNLGGNGHGDTLVRVVPNNSEVIFRVTGGEMHVQLTKFGNRHRLRIFGMGTWDPLLGEHNEIAVLPALGNVVEVGFVMPVPETLPPTLIALETGTPALAAEPDTTEGDE